MNIQDEIDALAEELAKWYDNPNPEGCMPKDLEAHYSAFFGVADDENIIQLAKSVARITDAREGRLRRRHTIRVPDRFIPLHLHSIKVR